MHEYWITVAEKHLIIDLAVLCKKNFENYIARFCFEDSFRKACA